MPNFSLQGTLLIVVPLSSGVRATNRSEHRMNWLTDLVHDYRSQDEMFDIFGIILYSDSHAHVKKLLRDEDYWTSLHEVSGEDFAVFAIRPKPGHYETPSPPPGMLAWLVPVWKEPAENKALLEEFGLSDTEKMPLLLVLTHVGEEIAKLEFALDDASQESAYRSVKDALGIVRSALDGIDRSNLKNAAGVFAATALAYEHHKRFDLVRKAIGYYTWAKGLLP
jgi:hypothetical protein